MAEVKLELPVSFFHEEEKILRVSENTKRLWAVELDLLAELKRVCDQHGIRFFAISGTLIGAARHNGFIPWDDDIDVVMLRSEYKKLEKVASEFLPPYFFQTNATDPGSARGHAQLRNSSTTAILRSELAGKHPLYAFNQGVFLDIFPLDRIPDSADERRDFSIKLSKLRSRLSRFRRQRAYWVGSKFVPHTPRNVLTVCAGMLQVMFECVFHVDFVDMAFRRMEQFAQKYNGTDASWCAPVAFSPAMKKHETFMTSDFKDQVELDFEMLKIPCPANYEEVLTRSFGNWREHVIGGAAHGGMFVDVDRPYTEYF